MSITLAEALELGLFPEAQVIAGHKGLNRPIRFVDVMEVPDPDKYFRSGLLLVSSWYAIHDDVEAQCRLVQSAADVGAAGFALKVRRYLGCVPERVIKLANELQLPIVDVVKDVPYVEITHPLLTRILHAQAFRLEYHLNIHRLFRRVALEGGSFDSIVRTLHSLLHKPVAVCDAEGRLLAWFPTETDNWSAFRVGMPFLDQMDIQKLAHIDHHDYRNLRLGIGELLVFPIRIESDTYGYFLVNEIDTPCTELDLIALENASTVAALEATKRAAIAEVEHHFRHDFVYDLISGNLPSEEVAQMRAAALGWNFVQPVVVLVANIDGFAALVERKQDEAYAMNIKSKMLAVTRKTVAAHSHSYIVASISDSCITVVHLPGSDRQKKEHKGLHNLLVDLQRNLAQELKDISVSLAVSDHCTSLLDVGSGYREACELMEISRKTQGEGQLAIKEELDVYRLLYRCGHQEEMAAFCQEMLGSLMEHDADSGVDLLFTLRRFLEKGAAMRQTARSLFIHENTLRYRLGKIEEITGMDLRKPNHRFRLAMALHMTPFLDQ